MKKCRWKDWCAISGPLPRFLQAMSFSHAAVLNLANISREAQVSRKTVEGYLDLLEDLLLGYRIEVFTKRAKRELAAPSEVLFL
jgi:predicted AAA+ superfamily ATPase